MSDPNRPYAGPTRRLVPKPRALVAGSSSTHPAPSSSTHPAPTSQTADSGSTSPLNPDQVLQKILGAKYVPPVPPTILTPASTKAQIAWYQEYQARNPKALYKEEEQSWATYPASTYDPRPRKVIEAEKAQKAADMEAHRLERLRRMSLPCSRETTGRGPLEPIAGASKPRHRGGVDDMRRNMLQKNVVDAVLAVPRPASAMAALGRATGSDVSGRGSSAVNQVPGALVLQDKEASSSVGNAGNIPGPSAIVPPSNSRNSNSIDHMEKVAKYLDRIKLMEPGQRSALFAAVDQYKAEKGARKGTKSVELSQSESDIVRSNKHATSKPTGSAPLPNLTEKSAGKRPRESSEPPNQHPRPPSHSGIGHGFSPASELGVTPVPRPNSAAPAVRVGPEQSKANFRYDAPSYLSTITLDGVSKYILNPLWRSSATGAPLSGSDLKAAQEQLKLEFGSKAHVEPCDA